MKKKYNLLILFTIIALLFNTFSAYAVDNNREQYNLKLDILNEDIAEEFESDIFTHGNETFFNNKKGPNNSKLQLNLKEVNYNSDQSQKFDIRGTMITEEFTITFNGYANINEYEVDDKNYKYGRIKATANNQNKYSEIGGFIFFDPENRNEGYVSLTFGILGKDIDTENSELQESIGLAVFGDKSDEYLKWVEDYNKDIIENTRTKATEEEINTLSAGSNQWEMKTTSSTRYIQRQSFPYDSYNSRHILYLNMFSRDPRALGGAHGQETVRVIGQEEIVASLFGVNARLAWVDLDFYWQQSNAASILSVFPESYTDVSLPFYLYSSLYPSPSSWLANIASSFISNSSNRTSNTNNDGMPNHVRMDINVQSQSSIPNDTNTWESYKYNGGVPARISYEAWGASDWRVYAEASGDFYLINSNGTTVLVRTGTTSASHQVYAW